MTPPLAAQQPAPLRLWRRLAGCQGERGIPEPGACPWLRVRICRESPLTTSLSQTLSPQGSSSKAASLAPMAVAGSRGRAPAAGGITGQGAGPLRGRGAEPPPPEAPAAAPHLQPLPVTPARQAPFPGSGKR